MLKKLSFETGRPKSNWWEPPKSLNDESYSNKSPPTNIKNEEEFPVRDSDIELSSGVPASSSSSLEKLTVDFSETALISQGNMNVEKRNSSSESSINADDWIIASLGPSKRNTTSGRAVHRNIEAGRILPASSRVGGRQLPNILNQQDLFPGSVSSSGQSSLSPQSIAMSDISNFALSPSEDYFNPNLEQPQLSGEEINQLLSPSTSDSTESTSHTAFTSPPLVRDGDVVHGPPCNQNIRRNLKKLVQSRIHDNSSSSDMIEVWRSPDLFVENQETPLMREVRVNNKNKVDMILAYLNRTGLTRTKLDHKNATEETVLSIVCYQRNYDLIIRFIEAGADPGVRLAMGNTCLHILADMDYEHERNYLFVLLDAVWQYQRERFLPLLDMKNLFGFTAEGILRIKMENSPTPYVRSNLSEVLRRIQVYRITLSNSFPS